MKKLIGTVAVAALLATAAFAEGISFGSWGRALWIVGNAAEKSADGAKDTGDTGVTSWLGQSWGGASPRTALAVKGSSDNVGFALDIHANGADWNLGDNALVWVKPIDMLKITFSGKDDTNLLRGDACFGLWNFRRLGSVSTAGGSEGYIFPALLNKRVSVVATPIEGLTVGYGFDCAIGDVNPKADSDRFVDQIGRTSAFAAAYTIANIGTVKLGFQAQGKGYDKNGGINGERKDKMEIDAAFELTMLEKVYAAIGTKIPLGGTFGKYADLYEDGKLYVANESPVFVNLYTRLNLIDNLAINVIGGLMLNSKDTKKGDFKSSGAFGFRFGVEGEYTLSNGIGFFAQVEYANGIWMKSDSSDKNDCLTFGLGATKGFSNGVIGVAFEGTTNGYGLYGGKITANDDFHFEVPVKIEYWF
ncbi:MAG: hypothetical protein K6A42_04305 [Treponema sp.]|nr:hypothetical protein [Treponema sp.]